MNSHTRFAARQQGAGVFGQVGEPGGVGDVAPALADDAGDVAMRIAVIGAELGVARGFLERVQVGAHADRNDHRLQRRAGLADP